MHSVNYEKINGKDVFVAFSEPEKPQKKLVIMSHGFRGSSIGPARTFVDFGRILLKNRISVLRFDQPNSGNSEGDYIESSFNEWVDTTAYLANKYLKKDYQVALLGQSMGASTTVVASARPEVKEKIKCLLLWVPDPKTTFDKSPNEIYEEGGQKYKGTFWQEAKDSDFFGCLNQFEGAIHLVYGENDKYISKELRNEVVDAVKAKNQKVIILPKQDHSPWEFDIAQQVYDEELIILNRCFK
jgi:pimeloyl-ACP methyl ester carboxylesterase